MDLKTEDPATVILAIASVVLLALLLLSMAIGKLRQLMSRQQAPGGVRSAPLKSGERGVSPLAGKPEIAETAQQKAETEKEKMSFAETAVAEALARLVLDNKIGLTDAVRIGMGRKSGDRYSEGSALVKAAIERLRPPESEKYRELDEARRPVLTPK